MLYAAIQRARAAAHETDRRVEERHDVVLKTALFEGERINHAITLINMSSGGFLGQSPARHAINSRVGVYLPGLGRLEASVRWSGNGLIGCEFDEQIEEADFRLLLDVIARAGHA